MLVARVSEREGRVIDHDGDILVLPGGATPAVLIYDDLFMIMDVSDFVIDDEANFVITSATPSTGVRGMNHVNGAGSRWAYFLVEHKPIAVTADPLTGGLLMADQNGNGTLRLIDVDDDTHPAAVLDGTQRAMRVALSTPFCMVRTNVSGPRSGARARAAASVS